MKHFFSIIGILATITVGMLAIPDVYHRMYPPTYTATLNVSDGGFPLANTLVRIADSKNQILDSSTTDCRGKCFFYKLKSGEYSYYIMKNYKYRNYKLLVTESNLNVTDNCDISLPQINPTPNIKIVSFLKDSNKKGDSNTTLTIETNENYRINTSGNQDYLGRGAIHSSKTEGPKKIHVAFKKESEHWSIVKRSDKISSVNTTRTDKYKEHGNIQLVNNEVGISTLHVLLDSYICTYSPQQPAATPSKSDTTNKKQLRGRTAIGRLLYKITHPFRNKKYGRKKALIK